MLENIIRNILPFAWAFLISVFAIPSIISVAHKKHLLDEPNDRTVHELLTPRLGGLAIFAGFISAITIFGKVDYGIQHLVAGSVVIFFIGLKDDIVSVSAVKKFMVQILATGIIMFMADIRITSLQGIFGIYSIEAGISYMLTFIVIIGITNAINLIDGLDGLAGSIVSVCCFSFGIYFITAEDKYTFVYSYVAFSLVGSILGFLRYNMYKAKIFMGDTGSLVCGFIVSVMAIKFVEVKLIPNAPTVSIAILFIPILDTIRVFILRIFAGKSPFTPDKNHIHHRLMDIGFTQLSTVLILVLINVLAIGLVVYFQYLSLTLQIMLLFLYALLFSIIIEVCTGLKKISATRNAKVNV
ncbi:MAG TPA: MraY family glycosyltransferase [Cytophagaceae bacterium]|jgi:UDP-GlcNAc:undecaprenyl-phosphate GlcNAc-1-phosphate transferase|nr:MraY family glycosyltransferase [Cytophagaceae bacterium]